MGVGNTARDFPFLLNDELAPRTTEEMLQARELIADVTSDMSFGPTMTFLNDYS